MKDKFITSSLNFINKYESCDELKTKKLKYGLEGIYNLIIKLIVIIAISIITKTINETSLFLLFYCLLRSFSYGLHTKSNLACWASSITIYNIIPIIFKNIYFSKSIYYLVLAISFISILIWAPADTPKKPLIHQDKRRKCKILALIVISSYLLIVFLSDFSLINKSIAYASLINSIMINPLTYKLTKTRFNNYKYLNKV